MAERVKDSRYSHSAETKSGYNKLQTALTQSSLQLPDILYYPKPANLTVSTHQPNGTIANIPADAAVGLAPPIVAALPGSAINPEEFGFSPREASIAIGSTGNGKEPILEINRPFFFATFSYGATHPTVLELATLAAHGFDNPENRQAYQIALSALATSVLTVKNRLPWNVEITDDCLASGLTTVATLTALQNSGVLINSVRINAIGSASIQALMVLKAFARQNRIPIEVHAGFPSFGLSAGQELPDSHGVREHANYLTLPLEILPTLPDSLQGYLEQLRSADGNIYTVGDMGDASKGLPPRFNNTCPWNAYRSDAPDKDGFPTVPSLGLPSNLDPNAALTLYPLRGGIMCEAYDRWINKKYPSARPNKSETVNVVASRKWTPEHGFVVALKGLTPQRAA